MNMSVNRTKVKVCGMTQATQVAELVNLGVDAVGVILHANSPRVISIEQAELIRAEIPAFISMVGVFVDCKIETVNTYTQQIGLDLVQLHGSETNSYASELNTQYIKAIRAKDVDQVTNDIKQHPNARALLLDPYVKGQHGGTGQQLDESVWPNKDDRTVKQKIILAGGLSADNLSHSLKTYQPYAVDLNSGIEVSPGLKDMKLVAKCLTILGR